MNNILNVVTEIVDTEEFEIVVWGQRHFRYIKQHHKVRYINLMTSGKLNGYLADIDKQAEDMFFSDCKTDGRA